MLSQTKLTSIPDLICANPSILRWIRTKALDWGIRYMYHTKSSTPSKRARNSQQMIWLDFLRKKGNVNSFAQILVIQKLCGGQQRRQEALLGELSLSADAQTLVRRHLVFLSCLQSGPGVQDLGGVGMGLESDDFPRFGFPL